MNVFAKKIEHSFPPGRMLSLDALRGFIMFWIIGGQIIIYTLNAATGEQSLSWFAWQFTHQPWHGMNFYDTLFPMFMFISGVALTFSFDKNLLKGKSKGQVLKKSAIRSLILVLLGIVYNNKFSLDLANMRYYSVLGTIGFAYFVASVLYLYAGVKGRISFLTVILMGTWAMMALIPVPGFGAGVFTPEGHFSGYLDRLINFGGMYREHYDPEGMMNMISASALTIAGTLAGSFLKLNKQSPAKKAAILLGWGVILILLSYTWNLIYPINKSMWTSSFSLAAISLSLIFLSVFYFVIDVRKIQSWAFPFVVIGLNSIAVYMANRMIDFEYTSEFLLTGLMQFSENFSGVILAIGVVLLEWFLFYFLYRKKVFMKV